MTTSSVVRFGKLLRDFRTREGLSQLKLAAMLRVDDSTINKLEAGVRKPPRDPEFYQRLREVPGFTDSDIALLLRTEDAPVWLARIHQGPVPEPVSSQPRQVFKAGFKVTYTVEVDPSGLSAEEVEHLRKEVEHIGGLVEHEIEWSIEDYLRRKRERAKLISTG